MIAFDSDANRTAGRHYGYPECCVDFYVDKWLPARIADHSVDVESAWEIAHADGWDRIPCARCRG